LFLIASLFAEKQHAYLPILKTISVRQDRIKIKKEEAVDVETGNNSL
jgi:hypothetical protein